MRFSLLRDANTAVAREHVVDVLMLPPPLRVKVVVVVVVSSKPSFFFGKDELSEKNKNRTERERREMCARPTFEKQKLLSRRRRRFGVKKEAKNFLLADEETKMAEAQKLHFFRL